MILDAILGPTKTLAPSPDSDFWYQPVSPRTASGVRVDEMTALNYSVCWAATRLLAGTAGWLPFNLYKRRSGGGADIDTKHRVHRMIHSQPNRDMGAMMFRSRGVNHQVNWGNTFSEIVRTAGGVPASLEPIHPWRVPPQNIKREDGKLVYYVYRPDGVGQPQRVEQENMFHVPSIISEDGIIGKGVIANAREAIGKAIGTQRRGAAAIQNGGAPPLALKGGKFKNETERAFYRQEVEKVHSGPENAGKWLLLPPDSEVEKLGFSLEDSQFIESEHFDIEEISRWYGVPPHLVGHLLRATFNNIEELGISFVKYSLIQWLKLWEIEVWRKLLTPAEQETHYAKFVVDALERGNLATRTEAGVKKFFNGLWTLNQWAEQEDMNPIEETALVDGEQKSLGDMRFVQQAMIPLAQAAKGPPEPAAPQTPVVESEEPEENEEDDATEEMQAQIASVTANTATLALSVERIVAAVGSLQGDQKRLAETIEANQAVALESISDLRSVVESGQAASATATAELSGRLDTLSAKCDATANASTTTNRQLSQAFVKDVLARLLSVEVHNVKNIAQQASKFDQRLLAFYDKHRRTMEMALQSPMAAALSASGRTEDPIVVVREHIDGHVAMSMQQLLGVCDCQADELPIRVEECVAKWHEERTVIPIGG